VLGWPVQGIFPPNTDGTDINYVDRSNRPHPDGYNLLVSGDDFGKVNLYRYPALIKHSPHNIYKGHSSHVPCVKFSHDDHYVYSVGGED